MTELGEVETGQRADHRGMTASIDSSPRDPTSITGDSAPPDSVMRRLSARTGGFSRRMAGTRWLPLWGLLRYVGRRSGSAYEIPVVALPTDDGFLIPLPFGDGTQWLKNIQAADRAGLRHAGRDYDIDRPEVINLETVGPDLPGWVRFAAGRVGIGQFVRVHRAEDR